jgi:hemerythrin-like domain-containing protein
MSSNETATAMLREEHRMILEVAGVLSEILTREEEGAELDFDSIAECVSFFRLFADACHHGKEEDLLFPELEAKGMPSDSGPIAVMLHEHRQGRQFVKHMADALSGARSGEDRAGSILRKAARGYIDLIRGHIAKEDNVLFNMADQIVVGSSCQNLCSAYGVVCQRRFEGRTKEELETLAGGLLEKYARRL